MNEDQATLLVVDDAADIRDLLARRLKRKGFAVTTASDGMQALELIASRPFDLVLLDLMMPGIDGLEVLALLRRGHPPSMLPVIAVTARHESESVVEALKLGANDYVTKPVDFPVLLARIESQLSRKRAEEKLAVVLENFEKLVAERSAQLRLSNEELKREIAERKRTEEALLAAKEAAELANRSKSEFLANMSHELRTPLNAIIGFSEMIKTATFGPVGSPKYREYATDIYGSGQHLLNVITDILDISKIEAGKLELHEEPVDVPEAVESCLMLVNERAENAGLTLEIEIADDLPPLRADERKLKQILINLLSNAVKFTPEGGTVTTRVWYHRDDGYVFQVADTGIGIAPDDIPKVLAPFGQVDSTLARKYEGTGLGLPLTKSLVEMHGGSFDLQSEPGVGTTVTARFPAGRIVSEAATGT